MLPGSQTPPAISVSFRAAPGWSKRYSVPLINLIQPLAELWFSAALTTPKPAASCLGSPQQLRLCLDWRELFACVGRGEEQVPRAGGAVGVSVLNVCWMFAGRHNSRGVAHTGKGLESLARAHMPGRFLQASSGLLSKSD